MSGRKPRSEELDLWTQVTQRVAPIETNRFVMEHQKTDKPAKPTSNKPFIDTQLRMGGGKAPLRNDLSPSLGQAMKTQAVTMDQKAFKRLQRGKLKPDGRIDLHGMTLDRAHQQLNRFVMTAHGQGKRLLLVITGKGKQRDDSGPIPVRLGVLRHQVPEWLRQAPLSSMILQVTQAHVSHGGQGAYYVYLRRSR